MSESVRVANALEVSVSFGRFENDSLSWEKWSSFSPNKYLEEVGKYLQEETHHTISLVSIVEQSSNDIETNGTLLKKNKSMKGSARDTTRKMTLPKRELNQPEAKKKVASPPIRNSLMTTKFLHEFTSGLSKSTIMPVSQPSAKKTIRASLPKSSFTSPVEHKRAVPSSLHMSLSLNSAKPLASAMPIRKSLIRNKWGIRT